MSYEQSGYIPSPQAGGMPPIPDAPMPGVQPMPGAAPMPGAPYQQPQPQPGWGQPAAGYAPAPVYAPPAPSAFNTPSILVTKLPLLAMIGMILCVLSGVIIFIGLIVAGSQAGVAGDIMLIAFPALFLCAAAGLGIFALLMGLKHLADQNDAKAAA